MRRDKFAGRYAIKLGSSVLMALCNFIIQSLLPRAISVDDYAFYSYNLNVFTSVVVIANLSTSSAMVAKYSKKCEDIGYIKFYFAFFASMAILLSVGMVGLYQSESVRGSFGGQTLVSVVLGLEASVLIKLVADVVSIYDAAAISRFPSAMQVLQRVALCIFVLVFFLLGNLKLEYFYLGQILVVAIVVIILLFAFFCDYRKQYPRPINRGMNEYVGEYFTFCRPLIFSSFISQGIVILMNHSLMKYSGTKEQAMFGAAWQLNTLVAYVFSPYAELMKRELTSRPVRSLWL